MTSMLRLWDLVGSGFSRVVFSACGVEWSLPVHSRHGTNTCPIELLLNPCLYSVSASLTLHNGPSVGHFDEFHKYGAD